MITCPVASSSPGVREPLARPAPRLGRVPSPVSAMPVLGVPFRVTTRRSTPLQVRRPRVRARAAEHDAAVEDVAGEDRAPVVDGRVEVDDLDRRAERADRIRRLGVRRGGSRDLRLDADACAAARASGSRPARSATPEREMADDRRRDPEVLLDRRRR